MSKIIVTLFVFAVLACTTCEAQDDKICGPNEVYRSCGSSCPPTCQNPTNAGMGCLAVCVKGCFCKPGYIRDDRTKKCVRYSQCPRP